MDIESLAKQLILQNMTPEQQKSVLDGIKASVAQAKEVQKRKIGENVDLVVQALKKIESDIRNRYDLVGNQLEKRILSIKDGRDGSDGRDGRDGKDGKPGKDGIQGPSGRDGKDGKNGVDGIDGVSVISANIDFDGSLVIKLSNGHEINAGEVMPLDLAERIKIIGNGGGTSQAVLDTLDSLQNQIDSLIPSQTGNSGKVLTTDGTSLSWASIGGGLSYQGTWNASTNTPTLTSSTGSNGYYYVVSDSGSTNLDGISDWVAGDWLLFNGSVWQKIDQTNLVVSVNGQTGAVSLSASDVGAATSAQGALADSATQPGDNVSTLTNDAGYITASSTNTLTNKSGNISQWTNDSGYLTSFTESDPVFVASPAYGVTSTQITNWDTAYGWGNHASAGYLTSETYTGTVTSVSLTLPTGLEVTGSPITTSGTLAVSFATGYSIPTTTKQSNWDDAYTFVGNFPSQTSNSGKYLTTDGSALSWAAVDALPSQTGNSGKYLTTDGTDASWSSLPLSFPFYNSSGSLDSIALVSGSYLPFTDYTSTSKNVLLTT